MKITITGGAGYIGSMLIPMLLDQGHHVHVVDIICFLVGKRCYHILSIQIFPS